MKNFADFLKANKEKIYEHAEKNTRRNKNGDAVISREEAWFDEDEWDDDEYKMPPIMEQNKTTS